MKTNIGCVLAVAGAFFTIACGTNRLNTHDFTAKERADMVASCQVAVRSEPSLAKLTVNEVNGMCQCAMGALFSENTVGQVEAMNSDPVLLDVALNRVVEKCPVPKRALEAAEATATAVGARQAQVDKTYNDIVEMRSRAITVSVAISEFERRGARMTQTETDRTWSDLRGACAPAVTWGGDLWPTPYSRVLSALNVVCLTAETFQKDPTPVRWEAMMKLNFSYLGPELSKALSAVPDYSAAQLRRAIQERQ